MRQLHQFNIFDTENFFKDKDIRVVGHEAWVEYKDGKRGKDLGIKYKCVVALDHTKYEGENVQPNLNGGEAFNIKVPQQVIAYKPLSRIKLINASASVYGEFSNQLSVTAEGIEVLPAK